MRTLLALLILNVLCSLAASAPRQSGLGRLKTAASQSELPEARMRALEDIAKLQTKQGPPSRAITSALVIGLDDDSPVVRKHTVSLLDASQDPEIAVKHLAKAAKLELRRWKKAADEQGGFQLIEGR